MKQELVKDWMSWDPKTITPDTELSRIQYIMTQLDIRRLPVVQDGQLVGIVTSGDVRSGIALHIAEMDDLSADLTAEEIMTTNPKVVSPETTIGEAAWIMRGNKVSGLPVVDSQGNIVGIITESDIFDMVVEAWFQVTHELKDSDQEIRRKSDDI